MLLFNSFLYIYVTLLFMYNISVHLIVNQRKVVKFTLKYLTSYLHLFELNQYCFLIIGDNIETNPGPHN